MKILSLKNSESGSSRQSSTVRTHYVPQATYSAAKLPRKADGADSTKKAQAAAAAAQNARDVAAAKAAEAALEASEALKKSQASQKSANKAATKTIVFNAVSETPAAEKPKTKKQLKAELKAKLMAEAKERKAAAKAEKAAKAAEEAAAPKVEVAQMPDGHIAQCRAARQALGVGRTQLSRAFGWDDQDLAKIEDCIVEPTIKQIAELSAFLKIPAGHVMKPVVVDTGAKRCPPMRQTEFADWEATKFSRSYLEDRLARLEASRAERPTKSKRSRRSKKAKAIDSASMSVEDRIALMAKLQAEG